MTNPPPGPTVPAKGDRIAKLLARAGVASRREIERMIAEGRIALDGAVLDTPATILSSLRGVTVDGQPVAAPEAARLFLYHKPTGLLVTERDPAGRPTIYDRLPRDLPRTVPVGRLDLNTEGLLLLTTDGGLKRQLELPATGVERTYRARAYGDVTQAMLEELIEGVEIEGIRYGPIDANLERRTGANVWIELTLTEGKNREVRHVLEHLGLQVGRLIRTRYGPFVLADLPPGEVGEVKQHDLVAFIKTLGSTRRAKGADLQSPVTVEARKQTPLPLAGAIGGGPSHRTNKPETIVPAPERAPVSPRDHRTPARAAKLTSGWGSRTRPSRPTEPSEARPQRGAFRLADERPRSGPARARSDEQRPRPSSEDRPSRAAHPRASSDDRPSRAPARASDQSRARPGRTATDPREHRTPDDRPRARAPSNDARPNDRTPAKPGKGPSGGRGHPPRAPKGGGKGSPRGKR